MDLTETATRSVKKSTTTNTDDPSLATNKTFLAKGLIAINILSVMRLLFDQKLWSLKVSFRASNVFLISSCNWGIGSVTSVRFLKSGISKISQFFLGSLREFLSCSTASLYRLSVLSRSPEGLSCTAVGWFAGRGKLSGVTPEFIMSTPSLPSAATSSVYVAGRAVVEEVGMEEVTINVVGSVSDGIAGCALRRFRILGLRATLNLANRLRPLLPLSEFIEENFHDQTRLSE
jgi:hypothetical protein